MAFVEQLKSGRWRGGFRAGGRGSRKVTATFDYEYEAVAWAEEGEARARRAAAMAPAPQAAQAPAAPVPDPVASPTLPNVGQPCPTVAGHAQDVIDRRAGRLTKATIDGYLTARRGMVATGIGRVRLDDLRSSDVERWVSRQARDGVGRPTINRRLKLLRMVTADAVAEHLIDRDPAATVGYLTPDVKADRILTPAEDAALVLACPPDLAAAVLVALDCGLRWSEVYGLAVDSVDGEFLTVRQVVERTRGRIRAYPKGKTPRVVPIATDRALAALAPIVKAARDRGGPGALLFPSKTDGPMSYESWRRRQWAPAVKAAGLIKPPGFHGLRHTCGSRLAAAGVPRSEIAKILGHADESTTRRYIHEGDDGNRRDLMRAALARSTARAAQ